jgi:beta-N-acetylhexosaminidase
MNHDHLRAAGRLFMAGLPGPGLDDSTRRLIHELGIGHFILFRRNCVAPEQIRDLTAAIREECRKAGLGPPLIAIDQEGGSVARLGPPFTVFADMRELAESSDPETALREYAATCGRELAGVGINLNFAPVLDVCPAGRGCFMERRSLGSDPATVARLGRLVIEGLQAAGVLACGKHFPGLGPARLDPHEVLPTVPAPAAEIRAGLIPFAAAVAAGAAMIMTSHTLYPALDPDAYATCSKPILTSLLRDEMGFAGAVVTDDLEMGAVTVNGRVETAAAAALAAGADLLLVCHDHGRVEQAARRIARDLADGRNAARAAKAAERLTACVRRTDIHNKAPARP